MLVVLLEIYQFTRCYFETKWVDTNARESYPPRKTKCACIGSICIELTTLTVAWACRFTALGDSSPGGSVPASAVNFVINTVPGQFTSKVGMFIFRGWCFTFHSKL